MGFLKNLFGKSQQSELEPLHQSTPITFSPVKIEDDLFVQTNNFKEVVELYSEYISKTDEERFYYSDLLWQAGVALLKIDTTKIDLLNSYNALDRETLLNKRFFGQKIAGDLFRQYRYMANTKACDMSPDLKKYVYLSFDIAYEFCGRKADRKLIPFLAEIMSYEQSSEVKEKFYEIQSLYKTSLSLEQDYLNKLLSTDRPLYVTDIWDF